MAPNQGWKIVVTDYIEEDLAWEHVLFDTMKNVTFEAHQLKNESKLKVIEAIKNANILVVNMVKIDTELIESLLSCKVVIRHGVGYDNIDVDSLTEKGILFINIPDYCIIEVAEQTIMQIMNCARKFKQQQRAMVMSMDQGKWCIDMVYPIYLLRQKTLGIIGCGRIGSAVLQRMRGFEMKFLVCDPYLTEDRKKELGIETVSLERVLRESDIISIHTPLNDETRHMIRREQLKMMKQSSFIINSARGGIVDELALMDAIENGTIAGAGVDVYEFREPPDRRSKLSSLENLVMTPHLGWYSVESERNIRERIVAQILKVIDGQLPDNIVNAEVLTKIDRFK